MADVCLEVNNLQTSFFTDRGVAAAVDDVSFTLNQGETLGIVGESGSGKSVTSLSVMRLLQEPSGRITGGQILFDGHDLAKLSKKEMQKIRGNRISMIFQEPMTALNPVYTIGRQIVEIYQLHEKISRKQAEKQAIEMLSMVGIANPEQRIREYPHQLSGGMRQRVMIAMSLACNPRLLIADEPTTALDVTIQAQILDLIKGLKDKLGTSVMLITHDLGVVSDMADKVMVMYAGNVVEYGTRDEVFGNMLHPYTQGLMKSIPKMDGVQEELYTINGMVPSIFDMPLGCKFNPRCPYAKEICRQKRPAMYEKQGHCVRCFQYDERWEEEADIHG